MIELNTHRFKRDRGLEIILYRRKPKETNDDKWKFIIDKTFTFFKRKFSIYFKFHISKQK